MSKKKEYQVKYALRAVIGITVRAESPEQAIAIADKRRNNNIFVTGIESIDEKSSIIGYDDMHGWNVCNGDAS